MTELKVQKLLGHILSVLALTMSSKGDQVRVACACILISLRKFF
ncbi:hypothetical protein HanRHA438_Chr13g0588581 [Helianthus annuus]|uniref:Uncharacterized protein n=1 Tax=Helianthus annuus TaxID=4232 RepID=A0A9K3H9C3_HELAN|nr:hypothetical protein HanXRQr2_Chr13g0577811 [Helianthus annuus]KAJ0496933.1 hypothetical protein HanHA89_Chr13g0505531 [Helianthus annuus]KAJ0857312.1 hypothetical protein HanRHA438_Chr13g0588581 [Helianthus annuus]